jgi:hypothetical protein
MQCMTMTEHWQMWFDTDPPLKWKLAGNWVLTAANFSLIMS